MSTARLKSGAKNTLGKRRQRRAEIFTLPALSSSPPNLSFVIDHLSFHGSPRARRAL